MKKNYKTFYIQAFIFILCLCFVSYKLYEIDSNSCKTKVVDALSSAISQDKDERWRKFNARTYTTYNPRPDASGTVEIQTESDTTIYNTNDTAVLSEYEIKEKGHYSYLALKYPVNVQVLDSIFRDELKKFGISTQTAVFYTYKDSVFEKSRRDSDFFASSWHTPELTAGLSNEIRIQGFAKITPSAIVSQQLWIWIVIAVAWFMLLVSVILRMTHRKKKTHSNDKEQFENKEQTNTQLKWLENDIALDTEDTSLIYHTKRISLTHNEYKLLNLLLETRGNYVKYDKIVQSLYDDIYLRTGKIRLNKLVHQLRKNILVQTPELNITNIKHKGYKLVVESEQITKEEQFKG